MIICWTDNRLLKTRINEYRSHIWRNTNQNFVITEYCLEFSPDFDWDNVEIVNGESFQQKSYFGNDPHKKQSYGLNLQHDTDLLILFISTLLDNLWALYTGNLY